MWKDHRSKTRKEGYLLQLSRPLHPYLASTFLSRFNSSSTALILLNSSHPCLARLTSASPTTPLLCLLQPSSTAWTLLLYSDLSRPLRLPRDGQLGVFSHFNFPFVVC
jgi:hypothetical protein